MQPLIRYKGVILTIAITLMVLLLMIAIGFSIGILSDNPDGLERVLIDAKGEHWLENLPSPWEPILGGIENEYIAGVLGVILTLVIIMGIFYLIIILKKKKEENDNE
ncbi:MAG: hypothetical protein ACTSU4_02570 [Promethearchaeota archaeon]